MSTVFRSPGVHTMERDISGVSIPKNKIRKGRINRIFGIKNTEKIFKYYYGSTQGILVANNYDEYKNMFRGS